MLSACVGYTLTTTGTKKRGRSAKARDGSFRASFVIIPGRHEYKFVADGIWVVDEGGERKVQNIFGSFNSIVEV